VIGLSDRGEGNLPFALAELPGSIVHIFSRQNSKKENKNGIERQSISP